MTLDLIGDANLWLDAICQTTDPEMFFNKEAEDEAIEVCRNCPIIQQCAAYAIENKIVDGVWGGTTPLQRANFKKSLQSNQRKAQP
jgi:WhiB family redox-sensing transcriptional regulator